MIVISKLLRGTIGYQTKGSKGDNRSVMPLDVLGCTRATMIVSSSINILYILLNRKVWLILNDYRAWDR